MWIIAHRTYIHIYYYLLVILRKYLKIMLPSIFYGSCSQQGTYKLIITRINVGQLPSVGNDADDADKERDEEEEKLRREAIKEAEEKRRLKHKKMEEEREALRQGIREKVFKRVLLKYTLNSSYLI